MVCSAYALNAQLSRSQPLARECLLSPAPVLMRKGLLGVFSVPLFPIVSGKGHITELLMPTFPGHMV